MTGQVYKAHSSHYYVKANDLIYKVGARGVLKLKKSDILVGDFVEFDGGVIKEVFTRKNTFIRPSVSNIDCVIIVVSPQPKPDFLLIDKLIINALNQDVEIVFVVNKTDLNNELCDQLKQEYGKCKVKFLPVCAKNGDGIDELREYLGGKLSLLAGQSAVGKTSVVNALFGLGLKTGDLSEKISRGKHTTTYSEIHEYQDVRIIDTPGFAVIDAEVSEKDLPLLYPEFEEYYSRCKFRTCTHISEPDCMVKDAVEKGLISKERYQRYVNIYNELTKRRTVYEKN